MHSCKCTHKPENNVCPMDVKITCPWIFFSHRLQQLVKKKSLLRQSVYLLHKIFQIYFIYRCISLRIKLDYRILIECIGFKSFWDE